MYDGQHEKRISFIKKFFKYYSKYEVLFTEQEWKCAELYRKLSLLSTAKNLNLHVKAVDNCLSRFSQKAHLIEKTLLIKESE
jgi:hypothetical protein